MAIANLTIDQSAVFNSNPPTIPSGGSSQLQVDANGNLKTNQRALVPATDTVAVVTNAGQTVAVLAQLYDSFNNGLRSVTPTTGINQLQVNANEASAPYQSWNAQVITTAQITYANFTSRNFRQLDIIANITAINTGLTFAWQVQDALGNFVTAWTETQTATGVFVMSIGPGFPNGTGAAVRNISLGIVGRMILLAVGTNATLTGSASFRT